MLYRHPELIGKLARARGTPDFDKLVRGMPDFDKLVPRPQSGPVAGHEERPENRAPVKQWAAFVLSGWRR
jgi:hypothetical protein